jgi:hypothetical protein
MQTSRPQVAFLAAALVLTGGYFEIVTLVAH